MLQLDPSHVFTEDPGSSYSHKHQTWIMESTSWMTVLTGFSTNMRRYGWIAAQIFFVTSMSMVCWNSKSVRTSTSALAFTSSLAAVVKLVKSMFLGTQTRNTLDWIGWKAHKRSENLGKPGLAYKDNLLPMAGVYTHLE